jgi:hypothetical protein
MFHSQTQRYVAITVMPVIRLADQETNALLLPYNIPC